VEETSQALWAGFHGITTLPITKKGFPFVQHTRLVDRVVDVLVGGSPLLTRPIFLGRLHGSQKLATVHQNW
jgi:hypothetical protein